MRHRDAAIRDNNPSGLRLLPDPAFSGLNAAGMLDTTLPLAYRPHHPDLGLHGILGGIRGDHES